MLKPFPKTYAEFSQFEIAFSAFTMCLCLCLFCLQVVMLCCFNMQICILKLVIQIQDTLRNTICWPWQFERHTQQIWKSKLWRINNYHFEIWRTKVDLSIPECTIWFSQCQSGGCLKLSQSIEWRTGHMRHYDNLIT